MSMDPHPTSFLGLARDDDAKQAEQGAGGGAGGQQRTSTNRGPVGGGGGATTGGSGSDVRVDVESPGFVPVLVPCEPGEGGVQGFRWYTNRLRIDEDGDVANQFLDEVAPENDVVLPKFEVNHNSQPTTVFMRKQGHCCRREHPSELGVPGKIAVGMIGDGFFAQLQAPRFSNIDGNGFFPTNSSWCEVGKLVLYW